MKKLIISFLIVVTNFAVWYLLIAFVAAEMDFRVWESFARFMVAVFGVGSSILSVMLYMDKAHKIVR